MKSASTSKLSENVASINEADRFTGSRVVGKICSPPRVINITKCLEEQRSGTHQAESSCILSFVFHNATNTRRLTGCRAIAEESL